MNVFSKFATAASLLRAALGASTIKVVSFTIKACKRVKSLLFKCFASTEQPPLRERSNTQQEEDDEEDEEDEADNDLMLDSIFNAANLYYMNKSYREAFELFTYVADHGHLTAKHELAACYKYGIGVKKNKILAAQLYKDAADQRRSKYTNKVADCYKNGIGAQQSDVGTFTMHKYATAHSHEMDSMYELARCYENEIGIQKNETKAFTLYKQAAVKGHVHAMFKLAHCYEDGIGVDKNEQKAAVWYQEAADRGYFDSADVQWVSNWIYLFCRSS